MSKPDQRARRPIDRRRVPRGGRRSADRSGVHPPILIAESYDGVRQSCSKYLQRFHFDVREAASGEEALAAIAAEPPQVILTELHLPTMPAWRLMQWLSQGWRTRDIPVLVMSGDVDPTTDDAFRNAAAGVLIKPFSLAHMVQEIRRVLRTSPNAPSGDEK